MADMVDSGDSHRCSTSELRSNFDTLLTEYPSGMKVNTLIASKCFGVSEQYIVPGNGAAELIKVLMEGDTKGKTGFIRPTFEEYPNRFDKSLQVTFTPQNDDYRYTADDRIILATRISRLLCLSTLITHQVTSSPRQMY